MRQGDGAVTLMARFWELGKIGIASIVARQVQSQLWITVVRCQDANLRKR